MSGTHARRARPTLADVAARAEVSVTTASFVLNDRQDMRISPTTRDRVRQAARILGYTRRKRVGAPPDQMPVIGFVSDTVATDHYAGDLLVGAMAAASAGGHAVVIAESGEGEQSEAAVVRELLQRGVESFIYSAMFTRRVRVPEALLGRPTVLLNCLDPHSGLTAVVPDEREAGRVSASTLVDAGHRVIWTVGADLAGVYAADMRHRAIRAVLRERGLDVAGEVDCPWWPPDAREAVVSALSRLPRESWPTAIIALNDRTAMGVYQAAAELRLSIPGDLSVVSFDDSEMAWWLNPGLTSLALPHRAMGFRAVELLLRPSRRGGVELASMPLHERDSVASPGR